MSQSMCIHAQFLMHIYALWSSVWLVAGGCLREWGRDWLESKIYLHVIPTTCTQLCSYRVADTSVLLNAAGGSRFQVPRLWDLLWSGWLRKWGRAMVLCGGWWLVDSAGKFYPQENQLRYVVTLPFWKALGSWQVCSLASDDIPQNASSF